MSKLARTIPVAAIAVTALIFAPSASAAAQVGETGSPPLSCGGGSPAQSLVQSASGHSPSYLVPTGGGVITSWSHQAHASPGTSMRLKLYRPTANPFVFITEGESSFESVTAGVLNSFPTRLTAQEGQVLGFSVMAGSNGCVFDSGDVADEFRGILGDPPVGSAATFSGATGGLRVNISALLEPDADSDGFGDETQDQCPGQAGPNNGCPAGASAQAAVPICKGKPATILGTEGNDVRQGTPTKDVIVGLGGNDNLSGLGGNDVICGGKGNDTLRGGPGSDFLGGQKGKDNLLGNQGKDKLSGKKGNDRLKGAGGNDKLKGGGGSDICIGGKANDSAAKCEVETSI
jgi:Ca2+-binding RTX toxin-like protein